MMTLHSRLPTPEEQFRFYYPPVAKLSVVEPPFPPTMLQDGIVQPPSQGFLGASTTTWILILAGVGVVGILFYMHKKRKKESELLIEIP